MNSDVVMGKMRSKPLDFIRQRDSSGELVRIVCMLMIVFHHFLYHALYSAIFYGNSVPISWDEHLLLFSHCLLL